MQDQTHTLKLSEKQRWAFYSPATELLYGGAAGGGKSLLLRISAIRWCEQIPGIQVYLFRRTSPELKDNHLRGPKSFFFLLSSLLESGVVKYHKQENEFVWVKTGSRIALCHCQYESDVEKYRGAEIHVLMIDEATHFTEYIYRFLRGRVRAVGLKIPEQYKSMIPRIEMGSNPGSVGHKWVKDSFVTCAPPLKMHRAPPKEGGMLRQFVPAKLEDNPDALKDDPNYDERLAGLGDPVLVQAMLNGNWDIFAGQFFNEWNREVHILPSSFLNEVQPYWTRFGAYDHGFFHPAIFGEFAIDEDGNVYMLREWAGFGKRIDEIAREIHEITDVSKLDYIVAGHDCWSSQRDGSRTIAEQFGSLKEEFDIPNIRIIKAKIDRIQGASELRKRLAWKNMPAGKKGPRLFIVENCVRTIECIPRMIHDPKKPNDVLKVDATEAKPWAGDDPYDMLRYAVMSRFSVPEYQPTLDEIDANFKEVPYETILAEKAKRYLDKKRARSRMRRDVGI